MRGSQLPEIQLREDRKDFSGPGLPVRWAAIRRSHTIQEIRCALLGKLAPEAVTAALSTADRRKGVLVQI